MIKFVAWLIRVLWKLNKRDRNSLRAAVTRWIDWDQDKAYNKIDVKASHDAIMDFLPMGAGYVLIVSQSESSNPMDVNVEITFSSNLSNEQSLEVLKSVQRKLDGKESQNLNDYYKK